MSSNYPTIITAFVSDKFILVVEDPNEERDDNSAQA
jgi:hypothetical protein